MGRRLNVVIVAEGAKDAGGINITAEDVQQAIEERLKVCDRQTDRLAVAVSDRLRFLFSKINRYFQLDVRVTKLGHVQRGGRVSFLDRMIATRMGAEAVATVFEVSSLRSISGLR